MHLYHVKFIRDGETKPQVVRYRVGSIVSAFDKCLREFSEAKLIEGWVEASYKDGRGITVYAPPSTARIVAEPAPEEEQILFGFLEKISLSQRNGPVMRRHQPATSIRRTTKMEKYHEQIC